MASFAILIKDDFLSTNSADLIESRLMLLSDPTTTLLGFLMMSDFLERAESRFISNGVFLLRPVSPIL